MTKTIKLVENNAEVFEFLQGAKDKDGVVHKEFQIREMTGEEEEAISKANVKNNGGKVIRTILERCITHIGTMTPKTEGQAQWREMIQHLAVGDQDIALLKIREETLGEELEVSHGCPSCGQELTTILNTNELEIIPYNGKEVMDFELPKGYVDNKGELHKFGTIRYPNGLDREMLSQMVKNNTGMANTMLLTRCIEKFEGLPSYDQVIRKLSIRDREYLVTLLKENEFGISLETEVICTSCGHAFSGNLNTSNFI